MEEEGTRSGVMGSIETLRILFILYLKYVATHIPRLGEDSIRQDVSEIIGYYCSIFHLLFAGNDLLPPAV